MCTCRVVGTYQSSGRGTQDRLADAGLTIGTNLAERCVGLAQTLQLVGTFGGCVSSIESYILCLGAKNTALGQVFGGADHCHSTGPMLNSCLCFAECFVSNWQTWCFTGTTRTNRVDGFRTSAGYQQ